LTRKVPSGGIAGAIAFHHHGELYLDGRGIRFGSIKRSKTDMMAAITGATLP
jgi:hypothetical protein